MKMLFISCLSVVLMIVWLSQAVVSWSVFQNYMGSIEEWMKCIRYDFARHTAYGVAWTETVSTYESGESCPDFPQGLGLLELQVLKGFFEALLPGMVAATFSWRLVNDAWKALRLRVVKNSTKTDGQGAAVAPLNFDSRAYDRSSVDESNGSGNVSCSENVRPASRPSRNMKWLLSRGSAPIVPKVDTATAVGSGRTLKQDGRFFKPNALQVHQVAEARAVVATVVETAIATVLDNMSLSYKSAATASEVDAAVAAGGVEMPLEQNLATSTPKGQSEKPTEVNINSGHDHSSTCSEIGFGSPAIKVDSPATAALTGEAPVSTPNTQHTVQPMAAAVKAAFEIRRLYNQTTAKPSPVEPNARQETLLQGLSYIGGSSTSSIELPAVTPKTSALLSIKPCVESKPVLETKLGIEAIVIAKRAAKRGTSRVQKVSESIDDDETNRIFSTWGKLSKEK